MTAILVLSIIGVIVNWVAGIFLNRNLNLFLHIIFTVSAFHFSIGLGIIGIVLSIIVFIINLFVNYD